MTELAGANAVLTGASRGIGPHIARALARNGVNLMLAARDTVELESVAESLRPLGTKIEITTADITKEEQRRNLPRRARTAFGHVDILINNAGIEQMAHFHKQEGKAIRQLVQTNLLAPIQLTRELLPHMLERGHGHIVNIAALAGLAGMPYGTVYAGTKAGLAEWSLSLHAELAGTGIRVSAICPGFVSNAGAFSDRGEPPPYTLRPCRPGEVAAAVIKALRTGAPQLIVTGRTVRPLLALKAAAPAFGIRVARKLGLIDYLRRLVDRPGER